MGALRVAFERREPPDSRMEFVEVLLYRQIMHIVENLDALDFDLAKTLKHHVHARILDGGRAVRDEIDCRGQAAVKRVHSRTRFAFLTAGAAAFGAIALICCDLP